VLWGGAVIGTVRLVSHPAAAYGYGSESEAEEESAKVELSERHGKARPGQSAIKLTELGPRMTLKLVKIDSGVASGDVLYHAFGTWGLGVGVGVCTCACEFVTCVSCPVPSSSSLPPPFAPHFPFFFRMRSEED
jgi:hypothetical protein